MREVDEQGNVWEVGGNVRLLVDPTPEWIAENQPHVEPIAPPKTELGLLQERVVKAEEVSRGNSLSNQELIELLIDMEVI